MRDTNKPAPHGWAKVKSNVAYPVAAVGITSRTRYTFQPGQIGLVDTRDLAQFLERGAFEQVT